MAYSQAGQGPPVAETGKSLSAVPLIGWGNRILELPMRMFQVGASMPPSHTVHFKELSRMRL